MGAALFDGWMPLLRTLVVGTAAYVALLVILRISGRRTLAKMNAFDLQAMVRARVSEEEIHAALRGQGVDALAQAAAVVLETDGSFSVIRRSDVG